MIGLLRRVETLEPPPSLAVAGTLKLRRASPGRHGRVLLEYVAPSGEVVAGQVVVGTDGAPDEAGARRLATATRGHAAAPNDVGIAAPGVVLQARGADRRLPGLTPLLARPGASPVSHRPERRAVVRLSATRRTRYAKVVRLGRAPAVVAAARAAGRATGVRLPALVRSEPDTGVILWEALPGRVLHEMAAGAAATDLTAAGRAVGRTLRALHEGADRSRLDRHGVADEVAVLERWVGAVARHDPARGSRLWARLSRVCGALTGPDTAPVAVHRDFHDKQVLVAADGTLGLLDVDTLALGDAALDVANLLVHLELRALQGRLTPARSEALAAAFVDGYDPDPPVLARVGPYAAATRLRLACVYAFRPVPESVVDALAEDRERLPAGAA